MSKVYLNKIEFFLPKKRESNKKYFIKNKNLYKKIGILKRRISKLDENSNDLAISSSKKVLRKFDKSKVDFLIYCTQTGFYNIPTNACIIHNHLGLKKNSGSLDINLGCSAYPYLLSLAKSLINSNNLDNVLLITSDTYTKFIKKTDLATKLIFSDGSSSSIVSKKRGKDSFEILDFSFGTDGSGFKDFIVDKKNSNFRNLRIITFRKTLGDLLRKDLDKTDDLIGEIDKINKVQKINLIVLNLEEKKRIKQNLEKYLINTNKKILLISENRPVFKTSFIYRQENIDGVFFTYFNNDIQYGAKYILKRILDIFLSLFGLIVFSPIMLLLSLYIGLIDGFPFYVVQKRVGLHGEIFNMYKFRSMKKDSHELREDLDSLNQSDGPLFKIENDPRILKGLNFVRKYSLDELLQFINVLKGDMSIVGPRPLFDDDTQLFDTNYMRRLNVLPGITGLLQINERNTSEFEIWYKYDMEYIENWSLYLDLKIILLTPFSIFSKKIRGV